MSDLSRVRFAKAPFFCSVATLLCALFTLPQIAQAAPFKIYWCSDGDPSATDGSQFGTLKSAHLDGSNVTTERTSTDNLMRGCYYDSERNRFFLSNGAAKIYNVAPDNLDSILLREPGPSQTESILGSMVARRYGPDYYLYWPEQILERIKIANAFDPLDPPTYYPKPLHISSDAEISSPFDIDLDSLAGEIYVSNRAGATGGSITHISMRNWAPGKTIMYTPHPVVGIAIDATHGQFFYILGNNEIWTSAIDGSNPVNLTPVIGPMSRVGHKLMDIDYEADEDKIYWVESSDPQNAGPDGLAPGRIRRANRDGTNVEDVIADIGYRSTFLTFRYGTMPVNVGDPKPRTRYVSQMPLSYSFPEDFRTETPILKFKQAGNTVAWMMLGDVGGVSGPWYLKVFTSDPGFRFRSPRGEGFPLAEGVYDIEVAYQDAEGNPANSRTIKDVELLLTAPTPLPTETPTPEPTQETNSPDTECSRAARGFSMRIRNRFARISIHAKRGTTYKIVAKPLSTKNAISRSVRAEAKKNGNLTVSLGPLKKGKWEFNYSALGKQQRASICDIEGVVR